MNCRLFVDMDGTLAVFKKADTLEALYEQGYFLNLDPHLNVVRAIKHISRTRPEIEVYILSSVLEDSPYAVDDKNRWLDQHLPSIDGPHRIFSPCGMDKKDYVRGHLTECDFLLDDYTHNLVRWQPGTGIKLLNGINHTRGSWKGDCVRFDQTPQEVADNVLGIIANRIHASVEWLKTVPSKHPTQGHRSPLNER